MDNLMGNIKGILDDPKSMEQLQSMAASLFGNSDESQPKPESSNNILGGLDGFGEFIDMGTLMKIVSALKSSACDERSNLLMAIKPHLSKDRQPRVDKAVKILKLVSLVPILKEQGILNF